MEKNVVAPIMTKAAKKFLSDNRDLVACVRGGAAEIMHRIEAEMMLDDDAEVAVNTAYNELTSEDSDVAGSALTHQNRLVRSVASGMLEHEFHKQIALSFLRLTANGALTYAIALTPEAEEQKYQVGVDAGCIRPQATIKREAQAQAAAETLTEEITLDWGDGRPGRLTTAQIRAKKLSNPAYGTRLDQMLEAGELV